MSEVRTSEQKVVDLFRADEVKLSDAIEKSILSGGFFAANSKFYTKEVRLLVWDMTMLFDGLTRAERQGKNLKARAVRSQIIECKNKLKTLAFCSLI